MTQLLETKEEQALAISNLTTLKDHPGWQLLTQIVGENIKKLEEQILYGFENETKETIDRKRDKLKAYKEVIETPDVLIKKLTPATAQQDTNDPYDTVQDLVKKRKDY